MRISLLPLVIVAFFAGSAAAALCPEHDLNGDCMIGWEDIKAFAEQWLDTGECEGEEEACANFDGLNGVNFVDFAFLANYWLDHGPTLAINEFMASNNSASDINDPQGDFDDWIEIYNYGYAPIDLAGMYLTDDLNNPTKWQIPSGHSSQTTLPADGFVVIWADDETTDGPLHANFKLSAGGEEIGLFDIDGSTPIDAIVFGNQTTNISYGRYPDAADNWRFFPTPTPLADNNGAYLGEIENVEFSHERGFYNASFNLTMA
ncbi:MAG: lamin tail domain-containing protein, partial [Sedimentisphaerales bacterium]